jgi:hypothetical protein
VQPLENFPAFYGTRKFTTAFTRALLRHASPVHTTSSYVYKFHPNILSIHLCPFLPSHLFPANNLYAFLFSIRAKCPTHFILLYLIILVALSEEYKSRSSCHVIPLSSLARIQAALNLLPSPQISALSRHCCNRPLWDSYLPPPVWKPCHSFEDHALVPPAWDAVALVSRTEFCRGQPGPYLAHVMVLYLRSLSESGW